MNSNRETRHRSTTAALAALLTGALAIPVFADVPWHEPDHAFRAEVRIHALSARGDVDTAAVRIEHAGRMHESADDVRIYNASNERVPYQVTCHAPDRDALISFRTPRGDAARDQRFWIYFGHAEASRDPLRAVVDPAPGSGPPQPGSDAGGWIPRAGLVLETRRRPRDHENPMSVEALAALIDASPRADGAAYHANIADAANPFGHSYYYISLYRGWIDIPHAGTWAFCTISNDGSFSFLNGEALVHWPGRHTTERGRRGEFNAERELEPGRHYIEYYHEDTSLHQMAFLGVRAPGQAHFGAMPEAMVVQPHRAGVVRHEHRDHGRTLVPRIELIDSLWPDDRADGQYTRYRLTADGGTEPIDLDPWRIEWRTGDGQRHEGAHVEHIYLAVDDHELTFALEHPGGWRATITRPVHVYPLEHMHEGVRVGRYGDYLPIVRRYEFGALPASALAEAVRFFGEAGAADLAMEVGAIYLERLDDAEAVPELAAMRLAAAGSAGDALTLWRGAGANPAAAAAHLEAALEANVASVERLDILARLIRHEGIAREDRALAEAYHEQAHALWQERAMPAAGPAALRRVELAMGDVYVHHERFTAAREAYLAAERLARPRIPSQVRMAQLGAYPERMRQHLAADRINEARDDVERWRERFPASLVDGELAFWLGRVYLLDGEPAMAVTALELALRRGEGSVFEAEAFYRLAEAHQARGDAAAAEGTLRRLIDLGLTGEFRDRAEQRLRDMQP